MASTNAEKLAKIEGTLDNVSKSIQDICDRLDTLEKRVSNKNSNIQTRDSFISHIPSTITEHVRGIVLDGCLDDLMRWNRKFVVYDASDDPCCFPVAVLMDTVEEIARYDLVLYNDQRLILTKSVPRTPEGGGPFQLRYAVTRGIPNTINLDGIATGYYPRGANHFPMHPPKMEVDYDTIADLLTELLCTNSDIFRTFEGYLSRYDVRTLVWRGYINGQYSEMLGQWHQDVEKPTILTVDSFTNNHITDVTEVESTYLRLAYDPYRIISAYVVSKDGHCDINSHPLWVGSCL